MQRVAAEHQAAAEDWAASAEQDQQLHQYFIVGSKAFTDAEVWKALTALSLPAEITFSHVKIWWQRKQEAGAEGYTSSGRSQRGVGTSSSADGNSGRTRWFLRFPEVRDSFLAAAEELLTLRTSAAGASTNKMEVVSGLSGRNVVQFMRKDSHNPEYLAAARTAKLGTENVKGVFGHWQKTVMAACNIPVELKDDVAKRTGSSVASS